MNAVSSSTTPTTAPNDNVNTNQSQSMPSSVTAPALSNQGMPQTFPQGQFSQYPQTWFPLGPTQTPYRQSGLVNPGSTFHNNSVQVSSSPINTPTSFGPRPVIPASFSPVLQNPSAGPQPLYVQQAPSGIQPPYMHQAPPLSGWAGTPHNLPLTSRPPFSASESARWLPSPLSTSASQGPSVIPSHGPPVNNLPKDMISPLSAANQQSRGFPSLSSESTTASSMGHLQPSIPQMAMRPPPSNAVSGPASMPFPMQSSGSFPQTGMLNSFTGNAPSFDSIRPAPGATPRPQQPSSGDFTFQPHRPPNAAYNPQNIRHPVQAPHSPHMRPMVHNMNSSPMHGFQRPQVSSHQMMNQPRPQIPTNFAGNSTAPVPPRHPMMPGHNAGVPNMPPRNFAPHPMNNSVGPLPPRQMHSQENHLAHPPRFSTPHQHFGNHPARPFMGPRGSHQVYDPFSPTAVPFNPQMGGGNAARMPGESDPEYEDLMASVGVK